jgi:hypothetical protein
VRALRNVHAALVPGGVVVDTQPVSARPPVESDAGALGTLDMTEWAQLIDTIDASAEEAFAGGWFAIEAESRFVVTDAYDDGEDFLSHVRNWMGTRIEPELERAVRGEHGRVRVHQEIRMRLLRARAGHLRRRRRRG